MRKLHIKRLIDRLPRLKKEAKAKINVRSVLPVGLTILAQFIRLNSMRNIMLMLLLQYVANKITPDKSIKLF